MRSCPEIRFIRDDSAQRGEEARPRQAVAVAVLDDDCSCLMMV